MSWRMYVGLRIYYCQTNVTQSVFLIDLPKKGGPTTGDPKTGFYNDLIYFLRASTLHENVIAKLENFDFSNTAPFAFVHTMYVPCTCHRLNTNHCQVVAHIRGLHGNEPDTAG